MPCLEIKAGQAKSFGRKRPQCEATFLAAAVGATGLPPLQLDHLDDAATALDLVRLSLTVYPRLQEQLLALVARCFGRAVRLSIAAP